MERAHGCIGRRTQQELSPCGEIPKRSSGWRRVALDMERPLGTECGLASGQPLKLIIPGGVYPWALSAKGLG